MQIDHKYRDQILRTNEYHQKGWLQVSRRVIRMFELDAAILFTFFLSMQHWCDETDSFQDKEGWFFYRKEDMKLHTSLKDVRLQTALSYLIKKKVIYPKRGSGLDSKIYYRIDNDYFNRLVEQQIQLEIDGKNNN